jgi:hypothetical protein
MSISLTHQCLLCVRGLCGGLRWVSYRVFFYVTTDEKAGDYLPYLFGSNGYVLVNNATELPQVLPRLYIQLTANYQIISRQ